MDAKPEMVVNNKYYFGSMVSVFRSTATSGILDGSSSIANVEIIMSVIYKTRSIKIGDLNEECKNDWVSINYTGGVSVFLNTTATTTSSITQLVCFRMMS